MKKPIIDRYEINDKNQVVVDVSIKSVEQLYHDFDKTAPYYRKELDQEFVDYITDCIGEIGKWPFVIQLSLENMPDDNLKERIRKSINSYYVYLKEIEGRSMKRVFRKSTILFVVGFILLVFAILANRKLELNPGVIAEVFSRGLTIAAWVSLWEALVNIFLEWLPHRDNIRLYNKVIDAGILFHKHVG